MLKTLVYFTLLTTFFVACKNNKSEIPSQVAKEFCDCVEQEMIKYKDSLIDLRDCDKKVFSKSRLMEIKASEDANPGTNKFTQATVDSARKFSSEVLQIIDTMCFDKFDRKRIKKTPHIPLK